MQGTEIRNKQSGLRKAVTESEKLRTSQRGGLSCIACWALRGLLLLTCRQPHLVGNWDQVRVVKPLATRPTRASLWQFG